jgi:hypothetical protein
MPLKTFSCNFFGKKAGALGICYWFNDVIVNSEDTPEAIRLAVYNAGHECVSKLTYKDITEPETPEDNMSDCEADADTMRMAGMGTDEDYFQVTE